MDTTSNLKRKSAPSKSAGKKGHKKRVSLSRFAFRLLTINALGLGNPLNSNLLLDLIEKTACDICFVQEMLVSLESRINSLSCRWLGRSFWSPANGKQGGVAVLISPKCDSEVLSWKRDTLGRVISLLVKIDDVNFNLVNIYAPTNLTD